MSPTAYLWIAFGGAFALFAAEALLVWRASREAAREPVIGAGTHGPATQRFVSRGSLAEREP
jgi:hypothetical protein